MMCMFAGKLVGFVLKIIKCECIFIGMKEGLSCLCLELTGNEIGRKIFDEKIERVIFCCLNLEKAE